MSRNGNKGKTWDGSLTKNDGSAASSSTMDRYIVRATGRSSRAYLRTGAVVVSHHARKRSAPDADRGSESEQLSESNARCWRGLEISKACITNDQLNSSKAQWSTRRDFGGDRTSRRVLPFRSFPCKPTRTKVPRSPGQVMNDDRICKARRTCKTRILLLAT